MPTAPARRKQTRKSAKPGARKATSQAASSATRTVRGNGAPGARAKRDGKPATTNGQAPSDAALQDLLEALIAARKGDFSQRMSIRQKGLMRDIALNYNELIEAQSRVTKELARLAKIIGREGRMTERAVVPAASGEWAAALEAVNDLIDDLVRPTTEIARVMDAVADGDLTQKMQLKIGGQPVKGEFLRIGTTVNEMVDQLSSFADEVTRVAREVGTDGKLGGQAEVKGVSGTWRDLTDSVNFMATNLTDQVRNIATVTTAVANGDLSQKITVDAKGEILELKNTINTMVDQLSSFADEVTRVAREVGTEGSLGGQAEVEGVSGTWRGLTENVNMMADNLTDQVRNIAQVATAVANGDLSQKITVDARGEILQLKNTLNTMVDQLSSFADEVTRVAREVGTEGKLGGQAEVEGVSGTWRGLTENVNQLASNLTTQVRAIGEVSTSVTQGDLTRSVDVEAQGEVAELKDNINQMISNLRETTEANEQQDWLKTNLARISGLMQGQRDLRTVSRMIMSELTPTVSAQLGAFYMAENGDGDDTTLRLIASYGYKKRKNLSNEFQLGEGLVGQAAVEKSPIVVKNAPDDYVKITSGLGEGEPVNIIDLPVLFEDQVLGVIELASFDPFSEIHLTFLEQLMETIGVVLNTLIANLRTEELLQQSQSLTQELQSQSEELQSRQDELKQSNAELEEQAQSLKASEELLQQQQEELQQTNEELQEKAALLERQNRDIEIKNREIELARAGLEERAEQLALSSKYKSEFLANMSHELRTPLNSLLILSNMLADNPAGNLDEKQVEFAKTINTAGTDLLELINDILDLSKVEAGKMDVHPSQLGLSGVCDYVEQTFKPVASDKGLEFEVVVDDGAPPAITTDEQRLQQVLRNLLSNAFKFTDKGRVELHVAAAGADVVFANDHLAGTDAVAFAVTDTGVGIDSDKLRLIFEAFQQADGTTSRRYGGTGLGLSISREIARLLGGEIQATSAAGEGSTFTLYLPREYKAPELPMGPAARQVAAPPQPRPAPAARTNEAALAGIRDDRDAISPGEVVCLVIEEDPQVARTLLEAGREAGFKCIVSLRHDSGVGLAGDWAPDAIVVGSGLPTLLQLKQAPETRHIPVHVVSSADQRHEALAAGAAGHIERPPAEKELAAAFSELSSFIERPEKSLLIVDDEETARKSIAELLGGEDVTITAVGSSEAALEALDGRVFDCIVLDLKLPKMSGFDLLEQIGGDDRLKDIPVIVHTGKELTKRQETKLRRYAKTIVVKDARSPERLVAETSLFLHRPESALGAEQRRLLEQVHTADTVFAGKKVLVVDDDVRNLFALASALEARGMEVLFAENGREGLDCLEENQDVDLVLMDLMMPEMDGYEATRALRDRQEFKDMPIICLTAKAMKGDREKSIEAGASDYITKPVDIEQLLSLMQVWLYR